MVGLFLPSFRGVGALWCCHYHYIECAKGERMRQQSRWELAGTRVELTNDHGLVVIIIRGVVTEEVMHRLVSDLPNLMDGWKIRAYLARYDQAMVAMTAEQLTGLTQSRSRGPETIPAALVCSPDDLPIFQRSAWQLAQMGILRMVFSDPAKAELWALSKASRCPDFAVTAPGGLPTPDSTPALEALLHEHDAAGLGQ